MITSLNLTLKLKQDPETKQKLEALKDGLFEAELQPKIDKALAEFEGVHFARVLLIEDQYIQVLTEFDGDERIYTDFFRKKLPDVFKEIFSLAQGAPDWDQLDNEDTFFNVAQGANLRPLGRSKYAGNKDGYVFMAQNQRSVKDIAKSLKIADQLKGLRDFFQS